MREIGRPIANVPIREDIEKFKIKTQQGGAEAY